MSDCIWATIEPQRQGRQRRMASRKTIKFG